jgi:hypothetical protein
LKDHVPSQNSPPDTLPTLDKSNSTPKEIKNRKHYQIAGLPIRIQADLPLTEKTFHPKFKPFEIPDPGDTSIVLAHHFSPPDLNAVERGERIYQAPPWAIYRREEGWLYLCLGTGDPDPSLYQAAFFSPDHTRGDIFHPDAKIFQTGGLTSLSLFPTDQIFLARVLADHQGCYLHGSGLIFSGRGLIFAGHSDAGKSTITNLLRAAGEILCDDRVIIRRNPEGFRVHGTWSHGDIPDVSSASAPLKAILFLEQAPENRLVPLLDPKEVFRRLVFLVVRPLVTADWWEKVLNLLERVIKEVPAYVLRFDRSGEVKDIIGDLLDSY